MSIAAAKQQACEKTLSTKAMNGDDCVDVIYEIRERF
jgi:hypothetical protein